MTKTARVCKHCATPLPDGTVSFRVSGDTESNVIGEWCSIRHYLISRHGPDEVEGAYIRAFVPVERRHADADTLHPDERIAP